MENLSLRCPHISKSIMFYEVDNILMFNVCRRMSNIWCGFIGEQRSTYLDPNITKTFENVRKFYWTLEKNRLTTCSDSATNYKKSQYIHIINHFTTMQSEEIEIWIYTFMIKWKIKVLKQISMDGIEFDNLKKRKGWIIFSRY